MKPAERGAVLVMTLMMLMVVMLLAMAASRIALQSEKTSRNDRDHQIAFQGAEAALADAEMDIEASPDATRSRSARFAAKAMQQMTLSEGECGKGPEHPLLGVCRKLSSEATAAWRSVNFRGEGAEMIAVPYGTFTGQIFQTGAGSLPALPPRYLIEVLPYRRAGENASQLDYLYRVTAVGFGTRETTQVALQSFYRKTPT